MRPMVLGVHLHPHKFCFFKNYVKIPENLSKITENLGTNVFIVLFV